MGLPRPRSIRHLFRTGPAIAGDVRSPCLIDYPYGLVLDRGYLKVWVAKDGLSSAAQITLAGQLEEEAARLREEGERGAAYLRRLRGGDDDAPTNAPTDGAADEPGQAPVAAEASGD